jgi:translation initiation factor 2 beta subunit (eIF-2beta)/eIF-5
MKDKDTLVKEMVTHLKKLGFVKHMVDYINNETTSKIFWLSESKSDGCIFQNKTKKDYVFEIMKKYITDKVLCKNCHTINTKLNKIKELRKYQLYCSECKSEYFI